jgi:L-cysteine desulfidase
LPKIKALEKSCPIKVIRSKGKAIFQISVTLTSENHTSRVEILDNHTNVVLVEKDGRTVYQSSGQTPKMKKDRSCLTVEDIVAFADAVDVADVKCVLDRQISYNMAIAEEGMKNNYGANVGKVLLRSYQPDIKITAKAYAAAASDARMNGCELPVVINSGSGNQGITASVPVVVYARGRNKPHDELLRALCVSNLVTTHLKTGIGRLSAYCGAVSAGCGAGAGIAYLQGSKADAVAHTVINALAVDSGIVCDGAKASCAAKIASAVDAGLIGLSMYNHGNQFFGGDGIVKDGVEKTIDTVGRLARFGMKETDEEIIRLMLED